MVGRLVPGHKPLVPGQNLFAFLRDPISFLDQQARQFGDVVELHLGPTPTFLISNPEDIRDILVTNHRLFHKSPFLAKTRLFFGDGLLTSEDELHLRQRRLIQPAFHKQKVASYAQMMVENTLQMLSRWQNEGAVNLSSEINRLTMVIVGQALFGTNVKGQTEEISSAITALLKYSNRLSLPFYDTIQRLPLPSNREMERARKVLDDAIRAILRERRAHPDQERGDLLELLLQARDLEDGQGMTDQLVRDEAMTLFLAGHETTANALTWTLYLLAEYPDIEQELHAEIQQALGSRPAVAEDLPALPYTRRVLTESMRLYPPAWLIARQAMHDYALRGFEFPKGAVLMMSQWVVHHDPRFFPQPYLFQPQRWQAGGPPGLPKFAYFPFGGGPRVCVGEPFAWMEATLILATILQGWQLRKLFNTLTLLPRITLRPKETVNMLAFERARNQVAML